MGMNAELLAIGSFQENISDSLDYDKKYYEGLIYGDKVITTVFKCNTTHQSEGLAEILGFNPWDFKEHFVKSYLIRKAKMEDLFLYFSEGEIAKFERLIAHGFYFIFRPNG
jgi:hypothetical protein